MKEQETGSVDQLFQKRSISERFLNPGLKVQLAAMATGLLLANSKDVETACFGAVIFMYGLAAPGLGILFNRDGPNSSKS
ncbi:hypothetical protein A3D00_04550 [Candidatus Woesebacteria bacterium RIFCSPHIGHO2_02_FULL_38_9]|uniref:Uncharacterized protein n=1 Tax=Candidatus Woesebacteria bacterium RIFCSPHIGHO2_01_FULL_39_28 TaxID=1802496 RepID=A0A1F7YKV1_9BACT|nr:MAG: hypothetical protein A2627_00370 [Candidatus Woesebacteria bacterium RIFCSPHIGHO2_01_FULL_39_28]OGM31897.1 MAG: hypothetical protein A3D00_04550 [Candidatus Woesebacteria bacterium RIFCSPHIGHO2_02_FULL_38_9]OGM56733.1 MAG: hypothetical protein A3A50_05250 [Candidatus Woesebacteria bacterium RIFCSPLOWO2_01_FULL_38_20]